MHAAVMAHVANPQPGSGFVGAADPANKSDVGVEVDVDVTVVREPTGPRPCKMMAPRPAVLVTAGPFRTAVLVPMTRPDGPREIGVPEMVMAGPSRERDVPAMEKPVGFAVNVVPPTVKTDWTGVDWSGSQMVLLPMTSAVGPRDIGVPDTVIADPPVVSVVEPIMTAPVGPIETVSPATVASFEAALYFVDQPDAA